MVRCIFNSDLSRLIIPMQNIPQHTDGTLSHNHFPVSYEALLYWYFGNVQLLCLTQMNYIHWLHGFENSLIHGIRVLNVI